MDLKTVCLTAVSAALLSTSAFSADNAKWGADRHVARGVACTVCHGNDMKNPQWPEQETCLACHDKAKVAEKTSHLQPVNPHAAPHNGDCTLCHMQHESPVNYCAECHEFKFKMPHAAE